MYSISYTSRFIFFILVVYLKTPRALKLYPLIYIYLIFLRLSSLLVRFEIAWGGVEIKV